MRWLIIIQDQNPNGTRDYRKIRVHVTTRKKDDYVRPTPQSYVAAVVKPSERAFASGITNLALNVFWAVGSGAAWFLMQVLSSSAPLWVGGGAKVFIMYRFTDRFSRGMDLGQEWLGQ